MERGSGPSSSPFRLTFSNGDYIEKRNGKLVRVRSRKSYTPLEVGVDLLGEAFRNPFQSRSQSLRFSPQRSQLDPNTSQYQELPPNITSGQPASSPQYFAIPTEAGGMEIPSMADPAQPAPPPSPRRQSEDQGETPGATRDLHRYEPHTYGPHGYGLYHIPGSTGSNRPMVLIPIPPTNAIKTSEDPYRHNLHPNLMTNPAGVYNYGNGSNGSWPPYASTWAPNASRVFNFVATKHVCANCGRLRSKKYQAEHPIAADTPPIIAFCRRCQKEASSTDEASDESGGSHVAKGDQATKHRRDGKDCERRSKRQQSSSKPKNRKEEDESYQSEDLPRGHRGSRIDKSRSRDRPKEEDVKFEEPRNSKRGQRSNVHINVYSSTRDTRDTRAQSSSARTSSPLLPESHVRRVPLFENHGPSRYTPEEYRPSRRDSYDVVYDTNSTSTDLYSGLTPRAALRREERQRSSAKYMGDESARSRRPCEEVVNREDLTVVTGPSHRHRDPGDGADKITRSVGEYQQRPRVSGARNFDEDELSTCTSSEMSYNKAVPWSRQIDSQVPRGRFTSNLPHNIGPLGENEVVVVTERYVYRPKRAPEPQQRPRAVASSSVPQRSVRQVPERIDDITLPRDRFRQVFAAESEASDYYHNDWHNERPHRAEHSRRDLVLPEYPPSDSHNSIDDEIRSGRYRSGNRFLPTVPTPPGALSPQSVETSKCGVTSWNGSVESAANQYPTAQESAPVPSSEKSTTVSPDIDIDGSRESSEASNYRQPYVSEYLNSSQSHHAQV